MQFLWFSLAVFFALTGQALAAFNVTLNKVLFPGDILNISSNIIPGLCQDNCASARQKIQNCAATNTTCLCSTDVVTSLQTCQECMFTQLIEQNAKPLDPQVGSTLLMAGYSTSCQDAGIILAANLTSLTPPNNFDGPFDAILPVGGTVFAVIGGGFLGISALLLLSNLS